VFYETCGPSLEPRQPPLSMGTAVLTRGGRGLRKSGANTRTPLRRFHDVDRDNSTKFISYIS